MNVRKMFGLSTIVVVMMFVLAVSLVSAQDATPTTEATAEATVEATAEATVEATVEAAVEATAEATVEAVSPAAPTAEPTAAPSTLPATGGEISPWFSMTLMALGGLVLLGAVVGLVLARRPS